MQGAEDATGFSGQWQGRSMLRPYKLNGELILGRRGSCGLLLWRA
jgi:hypothetical protein